MSKKPLTSKTCYFLKWELRRMTKAERDDIYLLDEAYLYIVKKRYLEEYTATRKDK